MSDASIYSGFYGKIRQYSALIDNVLIAVKSGTISTADARRRELGDLLTELSTDSSTDLSQRQINLLLQADGIVSDDLARTGHNVMSANFDVNTLRMLEKIADRLEREQSEVTNRIDGRL